MWPQRTGYVELPLDEITSEKHHLNHMVVWTLQNEGAISAPP